MCHNVNKKCIMCMKAIKSDLSLCAEGMLGNICVIAPMGEIMIDVEMSHPRAGSRTYMNVRPYIVTVTQMDMCDDCMENAIEDTDVDNDELGLLFKEMRTSPLTVDAEHINAIINICMEKKR